MVDKANCNCIYGRCEQIAAKNDEIERLRKYGSNEPVITHLKAENERLRAELDSEYKKGDKMGMDIHHQAQRIAELERTSEELIESLDEAKYDEPELRSKLDKQRQRIASLEEAIKPVLAAATPLDDPEPHWCQVRIDDLEALEEALAKEQDDRLSGERDQSVEGRDALNNDSALPAPDSKAKEQDDG